MCAQSCPTLCDPVDTPHQAPVSMGFSRQEYWSGLPFPPLGDLPNPGIGLASLVSPALPLAPSGKPQDPIYIYIYIYIIYVYIHRIYVYIYRIYICGYIYRIKFLTALVSVLQIIKIEFVISYQIPYSCLAVCCHCRDKLTDQERPTSKGWRTEQLFLLPCTASPQNCLIFITVLLNSYFHSQIFK